MGLESKLILKRVTIDRDKIDSYDNYPFNIELVKNFHELTFEKPVTFFVGENGVGKSTFTEALAVALGMPAEGGTINFQYETKNTTSILSEYLHIETYNKANM